MRREQPGFSAGPHQETRCWLGGGPSPPLQAASDLPDVILLRGLPHSHHPLSTDISHLYNFNAPIFLSDVTFCFWLPPVLGTVIPWTGEQTPFGSGNPDPAVGWVSICCAIHWKSLGCKRPNTRVSWKLSLSGYETLLGWVHLRQLRTYSLKVETDLGIFTMFRPTKFPTPLMGSNSTFNILPPS